MENIKIVELIMTILGICCILLLVYYLYKRKEKGNPKPWLILIITSIGLLNIKYEIASYSVPVIPIGVMIIYFEFLVKRRNWHWYRKYAWTGFLGSYILFATTLLSQPIQAFFYPNEPETYLANIHQPELITTNFISAEGKTLHKEILNDALSNLERQKLRNEKWIDSLYDEEERFPYLITGIDPKWGSGIDTMVFIEGDGKGWLITTPEAHYYYRSPTSIFKEESNE
ncbi:glycosyltransferase family protein [Oceanobacillus picturae]|uniref:hypothetical protein n=1 Tax=Oceanobacillus picturae TaxID=171693 RepID=UPI00362A1BF8